MQSQKHIKVPQYHRANLTCRETAFMFTCICMFIYKYIFLHVYTDTYTNTLLERNLVSQTKKKKSCLTINTILKCHLQLPRSQICRTAALSQLYFAGMPRQVVNALLPPNDVSRDCPFPKPPFSYSTTRLKNK